MEHLQSYKRRDLLDLPDAAQDGWTLKRYALLAEGKAYSEQSAACATHAAFDRLPKAGHLLDESTNHAIGFQIIHFAQVAVVSPVFYWQWGSVLARASQIRAPWDDPTNFKDGVPEILGCVWEMEVVNFEVTAWKASMLATKEAPSERLKRYLALRFQ